MQNLQLNPISISFLTVLGYSSCSACPPGTSTYGQYGYSYCPSCGAGTWSGSGYGSCQTCGTGTISLPDFSGCSACPGGWYSSAGLIAVDISSYQGFCLLHRQHTLSCSQRIVDVFHSASFVAGVSNKSSPQAKMFFSSFLA